MLQGFNNFTAASNSQFLVPLSPPKSQAGQQYGQGPPPGPPGWNGSQQQLPQYWMPHPEALQHMPPHPYGHPSWPQQPLQHNNWGPPPAGTPPGSQALASSAGQDLSQPLVGKFSSYLYAPSAGGGGGEQGIFGEDCKGGTGGRLSREVKGDKSINP